MWLECGDDSILPRTPVSGLWRRDRTNLFFSWMFSRKTSMDKTLEITLKVVINTKLSTCDDKGVFTDDDDTYRKHK
jgi:hypothetical protein